METTIIVFWLGDKLMNPRSVKPMMRDLRLSFERNYFLVCYQCGICNSILFWFSSRLNQVAYRMNLKARQEL